MMTAFILQKDAVLCHYHGKGWWPLYIPVEDKADDNDAPIYQVGRVALQQMLPISEKEDAGAEQAAWALTDDYARAHDIELPALDDHHAFIDYRKLITTLPAILSDQLSQAIQLLRWQADTQFCSRCSSPVQPADSGERAMVCPVCHLRQYPRVQPCIITAITRPNPQTGAMQILLAHHHRYGKQNLPLQYGLIAGFVEVGESLEHAVVREVFEEVGIELSDIRYVSSQPWPYPSNLMLGFEAAYARGTIKIQESELSHADFFDLANLPKIPFKGSIAYELIAKVAYEYGIAI